MTIKTEFDDAADWLQDELDYDTEELAMLVMEECVLRSPVHESTPTNSEGGGRFRGNWIASINKTTDRERESAALSDPIRLARAVIKRANKSGKDVKEIHISNNLPYAGVIDEGLYPDPVEKGTRINARGTRKEPITPIYEKRSAGGYSKQAPQGISDLAIKAALERSK